MNKFACYHKPTKCWVFFKENKQGVPMICLCLKPDATTFENKKEAEELLTKSSFNDSENYGAENFLEFQIKTVKLYHMTNDTTNQTLKELEISILETSTNFAKQQVNDLERKLKQSDMFITYEVERLQKELVEFKKCVNNFKRHLVEAIILMTASIIFIYALFFFYK